MGLIELILYFAIAGFCLYLVQNLHPDASPDGAGVGGTHRDRARAVGREKPARRRRVARAESPMRRAILCACLVLVAGCAANVTTTRISRLANGDVRVDSGKDVTIQSLVLDDGPVHLIVKGYSSAASTDAINAQGRRETDMVNAISDATLKALQAGAGLAAKGVVP